MKYSFNLFADYHQFHLQDEAAPGNLSEAWTPDAFDRRLALAEGIIGVGTARNVDVPVEIEICAQAPAEDFAGWDRVNECSINFTVGRAVITGCTDYLPDAARIELAPGMYRARVYYGGLDTLSPNSLDGEDHYRVALWPSPEGPTVQLKSPRVT
jgi:hypothetical protein